MPKHFSSVLIANRGEIAVRITRACRAAGLRTVAVYSDADVSALHVRLADQAQWIGPPPPALSYLDRAAIIRAALSSGAEAVHPGYGFLAEDAEFAEQCGAAGLVWIGPPPAAMRLLGDKAAAKRLAEQIGVPLLAGYHGEQRDDAQLHDAAETIGYPLLVKAAAGGGGRGMRLVRDSAGLDEALSSARREALSAFGSDRVLLERYLERPRHVEMQVFGDEHGTILYLGERDCSIQRRHQKVIEEAPAPRFDAAQRAGMGEAAVALARAAGYTNAGTVEFLLDNAGRFYFLEMNTRLQVEHRVTELVTGLDLVQLQLRVAAGAPLPSDQAEVRITGHAIECRLYAEDPRTGFLPSTGRLARLDLPPSGPGVLVDAGVEVGDDVTGYYDPLLAKIVVSGSDRSTALSGMADALSRVEVEGVRTNVELLEAVIASADFASGQVHTGLLDSPGAAQELSSAADDLLVAAVASEVLATEEAGPGNPWREAGPWRVGWAGAEVCYRHGSIVLRVPFHPPLEPSGRWHLELPDGPQERRVRAIGARTVLVETAGGEMAFEVARRGGRRLVRQGRRTLRLELVSGLDPDHAARGDSARRERASISAPMPGRIVRLSVKPGDRVNMNQTLLVLEAMKIEHLVAAPRDGVVEQVRFKQGDQVELGATLVELEDE